MRVVFLILFALYALPAGATPMLAITDLRNDTGDASMDGAGPGVAGVLTSKLSRVEAVGVVERSRLSSLTDEIALSSSGLVDPASAARAGKLLGADYLVFGSIFSVKLPGVALTIWVVDVETGKVVASEEVRGEVGDSGQEFFVLIDELAFRLLDTLEVRLAARDRIALGQVDVRELKTVGVYGKALDALDRGDVGTAEQYLTTALSFEPQFHLAEETLQQLSAMIRSKQAAFASKEMDAAQEALRALREELAARASQDLPLLEQVLDQSMRARFALIEGDFERYFAETERHLALAQAYVAQEQPKPQVLGYRPPSWYPDSLMETLLFERLDRLGVKGWKSSLFGGLAVWPWAIQYQRADVLLVLGRRDEAIALILSTYQHPGPVGSSGPRHPEDWLDRRDLSEPRVNLLRQELRIAELLRDDDAEKRALAELDRAVKEADGLREARHAYDAAMAKLGDTHRNRTTLWEESRVVGNHLLADGRALVEYRAFLGRVEAGVYAGTEDFHKLAEKWYQLARRVYDGSWYPEHHLELLMTFQRIVPPKDEEDAERYRRDLETLIQREYRR